MRAATARSSHGCARSRLGARPVVTASREAVARNLFKLMAIKDEYEVARLWTDGSFLQQLGAEFERWDSLEVHLAPPLLADRDAVTGHLQKRRYGPWMFRAFRVLARLKRLRGTAFDPFGRTAERRMERRLLRRVRGASWTSSCTGSMPATMALAVELASSAGADPRLRPRQGGERRAGQGEGSRAARPVARAGRHAAGGRVAQPARECPHVVLRLSALVAVGAADRAGEAGLAALDHAGLAGQRREIGPARGDVVAAIGEGPDRAGGEARLAGTGWHTGLVAIGLPAARCGRETAVLPAARARGRIPGGSGSPAVTAQAPGRPARPSAGTGDAAGRRTETAPHRRARRARGRSTGRSGAARSPPVPPASAPRTGRRRCRP